MEQNITKGQWNELCAKDKVVFTGSFESKFLIFGNTDFRESENYPSIGQLVEYLDCGFDKVYKSEDEERELMGAVFPDDKGHTWNVFLYNRTFNNDELVDALWEAAKHKLKQNEKSS